MVERTDTANSDGRAWGCASLRVRTSVHACVRDVFAIYYYTILPRLIMIIIKIIILYFIRIRHTDDFPSTGIPASVVNALTRHRKINVYLLLYTRISVNGT